VGTLYVLATPLGNLGDLSPRAREILSSVALIACEDTRRTARLLARFEVTTPTLSCHSFNERDRLAPILARLEAGDDVALVSDGGTPLVADPGSLLVREAIAGGHTVVPVPGPSAVTTLLSVSGVPCDRYVFDGFLPHRAGERRRRLRELATEARTVVVFETPHRVRAALEDAAAILGPRPLVLGRELTKQHETILRGTAAELLERLGDDVRGEITLVLAPGAVEATAEGSPVDRDVRRAYDAALEAAGGDRRAALRRAARELGMKRAELYRYLTELGETGSGTDRSAGSDGGSEEEQEG